MSTPAPALRPDVFGHILDLDLPAIVTAVVQALDCIPVPRSLCELWLSEDDVVKLLQCLRGVPDVEFQSALSDERPRTVWDGCNCSRQQAYGLLLMLLFAEAGRRKAREGEIWPVVREVLPSRRSLLLSNGQPTQALKQALEAAAEVFGLRHMFGQPDVQSWYASIYLQFGFTRAGITQLPFWLSGRLLPHAVNSLLNDSELCSEQFRDLWKVLWALRKNNIDPRIARRYIAGSAFVLPNWTDDLVSNALREIEWGGTSATDQLPLFSEPYLKWQPDRTAPQLVSEVINLSSLAASAAPYEVVVDGQVIGCIDLGSRELLECQPPRIRLLPGKKYSTVHVRTADGTTVENSSQELRNWIADDDIRVFDMPSGREVDPHNTTLSPMKEYALVLASDLDVRPVPSCSTRPTGFSNTFYWLEKGWSPSLQVLLQDHVLWVPQVKAAKTAAPRPEYSVWVHVQPSVLSPNTPATIEVRAAGELVGIRHRQVYLPFSQREPGHWETNPMVLAPETDHSLKLTLLLRTREGITAISREERPRFRGALDVTEATPEAFDTSKTYRTDVLKRTVLKFLLPREPSSRWYLVEGRLPLRSLGSRPIELGQLAGYGWGLQITDGCFNTTKAELEVAREVIDTGMIIGETTGEEEIALQLSGPVDPTTRHELVFWTARGIVVMPAADLVTADGSTWKINRVPDELQGGALAICFEGSRLGSTWVPDAHLLLLNQKLPVHITAGLARWFHLPMGAGAFARCARALALRCPAECLRSWVTERGLELDDRSLVFDQPSEGWCAVLHSLFADWYNSDAQVSDEILSALFPEGAAENLTFLECQRKLGVVSPLLAFKILWPWLLRQAEAGYNDPPAVCLCDMLARVIVPAGDLNAHLETLCQDVARLLSVDPYFLKNLADRCYRHARLLGPLDKASFNNTLAAIYLRKFREYIGLYLYLRLKTELC